MQSPVFEINLQVSDSHQLASDTNMLASTSLRSQPVTDFTPFHDNVPDAMFYSYDTQCRRRLLEAYYMFDQQHSLLFGRHRSDAFFGDGSDLPFPEAQSIWDRNSSTHSGTGKIDHWLVQDLDADPVKSHSHDVFQSMHHIGSFFDSRKDVALDLGSGTEDTMITPPLLQRSPKMELAYHTFMLCDNTPVRDLLAVAGESWVMSEKMSSPAQYSAAQAASQEWALGRTADSSMGIWLQDSRSQVHRAFTHALKILELHRSNPKTGLLFQEWSIYLASLVIWARAYVLSTESSRSAAPTANTPLASLDTIVLRVITRGPDRGADIQQAMSILCWTKQKIQGVDVPHTSGLTNGALDVLDKLITKGTKPGWFGS